MDSFALTRPKTFKSRIPVHIRRVKPSNLACKENRICEKQPLSQTSNINRTVENSQRLRKELGEKSRPQVEKASTDKICKTNKTNKETSGSQTLYSNKSTAKSSGLILKDVVKKSRSQVVNTPAVKNCKEGKIAEKASFVSQTSNANETVAKNLHCINTEHGGKSCSQIGKVVADKNIKNSKYKFTSSKVNTQTAGKININSKQNKKEKLLTPKIIIEKENQETSEANCFSAQKDLKFEANELFRKMILSGKELSPGICKIMPGLKLSSVQAQRPSAYQKFEVHPNPCQEALQAIASASARRKNRKFSTENLERKKIATLSPFKERNSFYTPCADPKQEVMKSLEALKARQIQKSALKASKKVTFNLNIEEYTAKIDCDSEPTPSNSCESRLTQINEGSKENTPSSPVRNGSETSDVNQESNKQESSVQAKAVALTRNIEEHVHSPIRESSEMCTVSTTSLRYVETKNVLPVEYIEPSFYCSKKTDAITSDFVCGSMKFAQETLSCQRTTGILLERNATDQKLEKTSQAKLYTPRPISFFSNSRFLKNSPSPEMLKEKTLLPSLAPIYTPLALKSMAKSYAISPDAGLSPVRLKLDFTEEKDTPIKISSVKKHSSDTLKKIFTVQRRLDDLADQECSFWLLNESIPVCGRYLQNPVAVTLTEGDEMHFLPIRL